MLARGSALRFMLTRLYDWLTIPDGALVQKRTRAEYIRKLRFHRQIGSAREYGLIALMKRVEIFTDGACSGNPGPGRLGRDPALRRTTTRNCTAARPTPPTTAWS